MYSKSTSAITLTSTNNQPSSMSSSSSSRRTSVNNQAFIRTPNKNNNSNRIASASNSQITSDLPDLSHLSQEERKIIEAVLERQKVEEAKDLNIIQNQSVPYRSNTNHSLSSATINKSQHSTNKSASQQSELNQDKEKSIQSRHSISDIAQEVKQRYGSIDTGNVCDLCKKTKFTNSGVGHVCFSCKSRCCIRCSFKYTTKTKEIWTCMECKKKQDALIKSGQLLNSPILNKKNYASDYILNKAVAAGFNLNNATSTSLNQNTNKQQVLNNPINNQNTGQNLNSAIPKRQLPNISKIRQLSQDESNSGLENAKKSINNDNSNIPNSNVLNSNYVQSVPELTQCEKNKSILNENSTTQNTTNQDLNTKPTRLKQTLIKQASLNNPPSYFKNLNDDDQESSLYENKTPNKSIFTSNQELRKYSLNSNSNNNDNNNSNYFSSPGSSISQLNESNTRSKSSNNKAERLQDPLLILKKQNSKSQLNSNNNLNEIDNSSLNKNEESLYNLKQNGLSKSSNSYPTNQNSNLNAIKSKQLLHTDSLSSDPSENSQATKQTEENNLDELNNNSVRKHSSKKRPSRPIRKQPALPNLPNSTNPILIKNKLLARLSSKQNSLTSSDDENLIEEFDPNKAKEDEDEEEEEAEEIGEEEDDVEEDENYADDVDEEIRSTTEYTTNDEMDIESASASLPANVRVNLSKVPVVKKRVSLNEAKHQSIDDYLVQNLKKEEIFAAKINKFLSPSNWQLCTDGKKMIGNIILKRSLASNQNSVVNSSSSSTIDSSSDLNSSGSLGLKIIGGRLNPITNQLSAYVVKVKKDSISDTLGRLQAGDEVVKWNGVLLRGLTFDEVYSIMNNSKKDAQIELIVERIIDDAEKEKLKNLLLTKSNKNADSNSLVNELSSAISSNNHKSSDQNNLPIGKIQLKIFHDTIENKLYVNVLAICLNSNLECIFCKLQLITNNKNKNLEAKQSEVCNQDKTAGSFYINEAFTYEAISETDLENLILIIETFNYSTKQLIGKSKLELTSEMFENQLINLEIFNPLMNDSIQQTNKLKNSNGLSFESLNSGSLNNGNNNKRRQLPQIPMDKQKESRDKIAVDLTDKARKIKQDMSKLNQKSEHHYSVSDSETMLNNFKQPSSITTSLFSSSIQNSNTDLQKEPQSYRSSGYDLNNKQNSKLINDFEKESATMPLNRRVPDEAPNLKMEYQQDKILTPTAIKDLHQDFENHSKKQLWPELESQESKFEQNNNFSKTQNRSNIVKSQLEENENSLYLNSLQPPIKANKTANSNLPLSPSQTFGQSSLLSHPTSNLAKPTSSNSTRPEKLFSARHLNQKTQNIIANSNKNVNQSTGDLYNKNTNHQPNFAVAQSAHLSRITNGNDMDSDGSEKSQLSNGSKPSSNSVISAQSEFINKGAINKNINKTSNQAASDLYKHTTINSTNNLATTTTTTNVSNTNNTNSNNNNVYTVNNQNNPNSIQNVTEIKTEPQTQPQIQQTLPQPNKMKSPYDKNDGTLSDSALSNPLSSIPETANKKRRPSMAKALVILGLSKKSNSASNLTLGKRFGFARSEEYGVVPELRNRNLSPSSGDSSGEPEKKPKLWSGALKLPHELPFNEFIENLGPGQKVSRQVLGLPCLGEIKLSMFIDKQKLNIEVTQVKNLKQKAGYRLLPNVYVKLYLFRGNVCVEKQKTSSQRRTLNPTYQETLKFETDYKNCVLQVTVWADYGKLDRKVFMGIAQIVLDDCNIPNRVVGWYKLYSVTSIITDFSTIASVADLSTTESGYSIASNKSLKQI